VIPRSRATRTAAPWRRGLAHRQPRVALGYRRLLVPVADDPESEKALDVACRLAAERHASITAVTIIEIPPLLPLDAHMLEEEDDAHRLLDRAEALGASYGVRVSPRILRAREPAIAIVEQAKAIEAEIVVIGCARDRRRSARAPIFGSAIQDVLKKAPCRVMVIASPPKAEPWTVASSLATMPTTHVL
jgi:nucleotide-binding universal stress UspA family protein